MAETDIILEDELQDDDLNKKMKKESKKKSKKKEKKKKSKKKVKAEKVEEDKVKSQEEEIQEPSDQDEDKKSPTEEGNVDNPESMPIEEGATDDQMGEVEHYFDKSAGDERKIFLSRIPAAFNEESITRCLNEALGTDSVEDVALSEAKKEDDEGFENRIGDCKDGKEHRGFAFVTMVSVEKRDEAIKKGTVKGKVKESSKRKYTIYIRPIVRDDDEIDENSNQQVSDICFLWTKFRCPYGDDCKFQHVGEGSCIEKKEPVQDKRSTQKCFAFKTKGKCKLGDKCPFRHDFEPNKSENIVKKDVKEKDCINWKTTGKCRKGDKCPYRHDDEVRQAFLDKKNKKATEKRGREDKVSQPLSIRVFGLNYDTTEEDVRDYFKHCGKISEITFPTYEDSGRSKGYCGVLFVSPKATAKACELDGQELQGRWLSVQPGKMYLRQWEQREQQRKEDGQESAPAEEEQLGEFGQKVKKRKKHGFKD